jgi:hypothetical protein
MKVIIRGTGEKSKHNWNWTIPEAYEINISRDDGHQPTPPEILTALKLAVEAMTPKRRTRKKRVSGASDALPPPTGVQTASQAQTS